jgi:hypothetical protein
VLENYFVGGLGLRQQDLGQHGGCASEEGSSVCHPFSI